MNKIMENDTLPYEHTAEYKSRIDQLLALREEYFLIATLQPKIYIDGDKWCVLYGEDIQNGVCGFGASPELAVYDFNKKWHTKLKAGGE